MDYSRRKLLAGLAVSAMSGCINTDSTQYQPGNNKCGDEYISPTTDGTLSSVEQDWPAPQYDSRNTGYNEEVSADETTCGRVRYVRDIAPEDGFIVAATLQDGTVYVSRWNDIIAVDATTGRPEWTVTVPHRITTAPVLTANRAFVGTRGGLVAVDITSQSVDWSTPLCDTAFEAIERPCSILNPPAVSAKRVFVGTIAGQFAALSVESGEVEWSVLATRLPDESSPPGVANIPRFAGPPAIANGVVLIANWNNIIYAFDVSTGDELWRNVGASRGEPAPTIVGNTVLATTQVDLTALRLTDGTVRWRHRGDPGSVALSTTVVDDTIHVASGDAYESLNITALDREDQTIDWRVPGRPQTSASADPSTLYLGLYSNLVAIDRNTGSVAWEMKMAPVSGPPIVTDGAVIALDKAGLLYGIDTSGD